MRGHPRFLVRDPSDFLVHHRVADSVRSLGVRLTRQAIQVLGCKARVPLAYGLWRGAQLLPDPPSPDRIDPAAQTSTTCARMVSSWEILGHGVRSRLRQSSAFFGCQNNWFKSQAHRIVVPSRSTLSLDIERPSKIQQINSSGHWVLDKLPSALKVLQRRN